MAQFNAIQLFGSLPMSEQLKRQLGWFLRNLNLLIEDYELEQEGIEVNLYFDTLDVKHTVLGIQAFYYAGGFDEPKVQTAFQTREGGPLRDRTLVLCLAFSGRLGKINLLPPHQSEFLDLLNKEFHVDYNVPSSQLVRQFLQAISRTESIKKDMAELRELSSQKDVSDEQAIQFAREHAGKHAASAMHFYKIIQLIRGVTWKERMRSLHKEVLELKPYDIDYDEIIRRKEFGIFYESFKSKREQRWSSNFADAIALTILVDQVEKINKSNQGPVPRFFVSHPTGATTLFPDVLRDTGLEQSLRYLGSGKRDKNGGSTVFREADYFVFKSTFQPENRVTSPEDKNGFTTPQELYELRDKIAKILEPPSLLTPASMDEIVVSGKALKQVIGDLNTLLFFKNVWLPSSKQDVELVLEDLKRAAEELESEEFKHTVNERIEECRVSLVENVREYEKLKLLWRRMEEAAKYLEMRWRERIPYRMDYFRDFGLLRFSFPDSANSRIHDVLDELLNGTIEDERATYTNIVTSCYLAQLESPEQIITDIQLTDLVAAAAVFWVAKMYEQLVDLLSKITPLPHYSLELTYAAALFEMHQDNEEGPKMLHLLEERHHETNDSRERADLAVGLAYLKFHLWKKLGYGPVWDRTGNQYKTDDYGAALVNKAIHLAFEAWKTVGEWDKKKEIYALNQYLYYLVSEGDKDKIQEIHSAAGDLLGKRRVSVSELWQHRFDDSLAHYHHWLALSEPADAGWKKYMDIAEYYATEASTKAPWDKECITYLHILQNQLKQGFKDHNAPAPIEGQS
jgi:hypothetical protein